MRVAQPEERQERASRGQAERRDPRRRQRRTRRSSGVEQNDFCRNKVDPFYNTCQFVIVKFVLFVVAHNTLIMHFNILRSKMMFLFCFGV